MAIGIATACIIASCALTAHAGIVMPEQIHFGAEDLERSFNDDASGAGSSAPSSNSRQQSWPPNENDEPSNPLGLVNNSTLPTSNSSSSSSTGGAFGSGVVLCVFGSTTTIADDAVLGRLAEDHGLSLPDPPGTDLLRPPRG